MAAPSGGAAAIWAGGYLLPAGGRLLLGRGGGLLKPGGAAATGAEERAAPADVVSDPCCGASGLLLRRVGAPLLRRGLLLPAGDCRYRQGGGSYRAMGRAVGAERLALERESVLLLRAGLLLSVGARLGGCYWSEGSCHLGGVGGCHRLRGSYHLGGVGGYHRLGSCCYRGRWASCW